jgi:hypothetical protein
MKTLSLDPVFMFFGAVGCLVLLLGCLLVTAYLLGDYLQRRKPVEHNSPDDDLFGREGSRPGWLAQLFIVLFGGVLLVVACFWWAGLALAHLRPSTASLSANVSSHESLFANLFPWS